MRTEELWNEKVKWSIIKREFTPRIQMDLQQIKEPLIEDVKSIYLHGASDTGKTIYAAFLYLFYRKKMYMDAEIGQTYFISTSELVYELKKSFDKDSDISEADIVNKYKTCRLLVLDDFGTTIPSDWIYQVLYLIINYRYEYNLLTVFTSNLGLTELQKLFGDDRIPSRIERMCQIIKKNKYKK